MGRYRKKPIVVEAFKWTGGHDQTEDPEWIVECLKSGRARVCEETETISYYDNNKPVSIVLDFWLEIETLEGTMRADRGDYIIKGIKGEIYPCKPDIFVASYEIVLNDND